MLADCATPEGLARNPELVLNFYNGLRAKLENIKPNDGHNALVRLEEYFDVHVVTQNVDNLHEKAGSKNVIHLHGELTKVRSIANENLIYDIGYKSIKLGDKASDGQQCWFGGYNPQFSRRSGGWSGYRRRDFGRLQHGECHCSCYGHCNTFWIESLSR